MGSVREPYPHGVAYPADAAVVQGLRQVVAKTPFSGEWHSSVNLGNGTQGADSKIVRLNRSLG